jgi:hypothetical protein
LQLIGIERIEFCLLKVFLKRDEINIDFPNFFTNFEIECKLDLQAIAMTLKNLWRIGRGEIESARVFA